MMRNGSVAQPLEEWIREAHPRANASNIQKILHQCGATGLDPRSGDVHLIQRGPNLTIQVGIDGLRKIAAKTNELDGVTEEWCAADGVWVEAWLATSPPAAARVTVYRKGCSHPFVAIAKWEEYAQTTGLWSKMPSLMIAKVAEARALRRGFPGELGGLYGDEEMDQAHGESPVRVRETADTRSGPADMDATYVTWKARLTEIARTLGRDALIAAIEDDKESKEPERVALVDRLREDREGWEALVGAAAEKTI
jgi:phage recombination protein Bet